MVWWDICLFVTISTLPRKLLFLAIFPPWWFNTSPDMVPTALNWKVSSKKWDSRWKNLKASEVGEGSAISLCVHVCSTEEKRNISLCIYVIALSHSVKGDVAAQKSGTLHEHFLLLLHVIGSTWEIQRGQSKGVSPQPHLFSAGKGCSHVTMCREICHVPLKARISPLWISQTIEKEGGRQTVCRFPFWCSLNFISVQLKRVSRSETSIHLLFLPSEGS